VLKALIILEKMKQYVNGVMKMAKLIRTYDCRFCKRTKMRQDGYIIHLEFHLKDLAKKLSIVIQ